MNSISEDEQPRYEIILVGTMLLLIYFHVEGSEDMYSGTEHIEATKIMSHVQIKKQGKL
jgi:hypothetical protein